MIRIRLPPIGNAGEAPLVRAEVGIGRARPLGRRLGLGVGMPRARGRFPDHDRPGVHEGELQVGPAQELAQGRHRRCIGGNSGGGQSGSQIRAVDQLVAARLGIGLQRFGKRLRRPHGRGPFGTDARKEDRRGKRRRNELQTQRKAAALDRSSIRRRPAGGRLISWRRRQWSLGTDVGCRRCGDRPGRSHRCRGRRSMTPDRPGRTRH